MRSFSSLASPILKSISLDSALNQLEDNSDISPRKDYRPYSTEQDMKQDLQNERGLTLRKSNVLIENTEIQYPLNSTEHCYIAMSNASCDIGLYDGSGEKSLRLSHVLDYVNNDSVRNMIGDVKMALTQGGSIKLVADGTSGTYFIRDSKLKNKAVFKPVDEEAYAPNNPKGYTGDFGSNTLREGILSGELASREVAAYFLDSHGFHGVPTTSLVEINEECFFRLYEGQRAYSLCRTGSKIGSLQEFVDCSEVSCNFSSSEFPTSEVHKIAILDIRILNCDRNQENILVKRLPSNSNIKTRDNGAIKQTKVLIPIDHGLSFPSEFSTFTDEIAWMEWDQSKEPFSNSEKEFIYNLNPKRDAHLLSSLLKIKGKCVRNMLIAGMVLKKGVEYGLSAYEIGNIIYRRRFDEDYNEIEEPEQAPVTQMLKLVEEEIKTRNNINNANIEKLLAKPKINEIDERIEYIREETDSQNSSFSTNLSSTLRVEGSDKGKHQSVGLSENEAFLTPNLREKYTKKANEVKKLRSLSMNDELVEPNKFSPVISISKAPEEKIEFSDDFTIDEEDTKEIAVSKHTSMVRSSSLPDINAAENMVEIANNDFCLKMEGGSLEDEEMEYEELFFSSFERHLEEYLKTLLREDNTEN